MRAVYRKFFHRKPIHRKYIHIRAIHIRSIHRISIQSRVIHIRSMLGLQSLDEALPLNHAYGIHHVALNLHWPF